MGPVDMQTAMQVWQQMQGEAQQMLGQVRQQFPQIAQQAAQLTGGGGGQ